VTLFKTVESSRLTSSRSVCRQGKAHDHLAAAIELASWLEAEPLIEPGRPAVLGNVAGEQFGRALGPCEVSHLPYGFGAVTAALVWRLLSVILRSVTAMAVRLRLDPGGRRPPRDGSPSWCLGVFAPASPERIGSGFRLPIASEDAFLVAADPHDS
jgi:hypothetical protein